MHKLNEKQIEELFNGALQAKRDGVPLVDVFKEIAKKYNLSAGSIRNIYYLRLKNKSTSELTAKKIVPFSKEEEEEILRRILIARGKTNSMRSAFLTVANGDEKLALRYQNKYCNMLKKQRGNILREILLQKKEFGKCFNPYLNKREREEKNKLEKEIEELVFVISEKCKKENDLLKQKLIRYQKLTSGNELFDKEEKIQRGVSSFFEKNKKRALKGKVN